MFGLGLLKGPESCFKDHRLRFWGLRIETPSRGRRIEFLSGQVHRADSNRVLRTVVFIREAQTSLQQFYLQLMRGCSLFCCMVFRSTVRCPRRLAICLCGLQLKPDKPGHRQNQDNLRLHPHYIGFLVSIYIESSTKLVVACVIIPLRTIMPLILDGLNVSPSEAQAGLRAGGGASATRPRTPNSKGSRNA